MKKLFLTLCLALAAGHTLSIKRHAEINLNGGFSVEKGAKLVIQ